jgi:hypothetical protein
VAIFSEQIKLLLTASANGAITPLKDLEGQARKTNVAVDNLSKVNLSSIGKGVVAGAAALVGTNLVGYLNETVTAYVDAAEAANQLSKATNASVEDASRFAAVAQGYGLDMMDLTEIFSDFQQAATKSGDELEKLGVSLVKGANGTTDWTRTVTNFLTAMQGITDATERNRLMFKYFGEEGAKQLMSLVNSGMSVKDALNAIGNARVMKSGDIKGVAEYRRAMLDLDNAVEVFRTNIARDLVPTITKSVQVLTGFVNAVSEVPPSVTKAGLAIGAFVVASKGLSALGIGAGLKKLASDWAEMSANVGKAGAAQAASLGIMQKTSAALRSPTGAAISLAISFTLASEAVSSYNDQIKLAAENTKIMTTEQATQAYDQLSLWEKLGDAIKDVFSWEGIKETFSWGGPSKGDIVEDFQKDVEAAKKAQRDMAATQGASTLAAFEQKDAQKALNDALADGANFQGDLADVVNKAGQAQYRQNQVTKQAKELMDAYAAASWDAVNATLAQIDKNYAQNRAVREYHKQVEETNKILRDSKKSQEDKNQALDDLGISALNAANALVELKSQEALLAGTTLSAKEKNDILIASLKERKREASTKPERDEIDALIKKLQTAQVTAGETYIELGGIKFKEGTTEQQVNILKQQIAQAAATGNVGLATSLQAELDALKVPDLPMKVTLVGSDGKTPLAGEQSVVINTTTPGAEAAAATLTGLVNPAQPYEAKINTKVYGWFAAEAILAGLAKDRYSTIWVTTKQTGGAESTPTEVPGQGAGRALNYAMSASDTGFGRYAAGENGASYKVRNGSLTMSPRKDSTSVNVYLDGRQIASYLEPAVRGGKRSA